MQKKVGWLILFLTSLMLGLTGCSVRDALESVSSSYEQEYVDTPDNNGGDIDWSFVPVVREKAVTMFTEGAPDAEVEEVAVVSKNGKSDRVIVVITYKKNGKTGTYGFDYSLENGEYVLKRLGEGVRSSDI